MKILYVRGKIFSDFVDWLGLQIRRPEYGYRVPSGAAKDIVRRLEPIIANRVFLEAANMARTCPRKKDVAKAIALNLLSRAQAVLSPVGECPMRGAKMSGEGDCSSLCTEADSAPHGCESEKK